MGAFKSKALDILKKNGIDNPQPNLWYPQEAWLAAFREIQDTIGTSTLFQIGMKIPESAKFPPEINTIEKALGAIDVAYHMNHRGGEIGSYKFVPTGDRQAKMICRNPYPCDFDRGIIEAMVRRFKPANSVAMVKHDNGQPCRKNGADSCTYLISW
jgi:hypothetical protein